jgi:hypothetical protein
LPSVPVGGKHLVGTDLAGQRGDEYDVFVEPPRAGGSLLLTLAVSLSHSPHGFFHVRLRLLQRADTHLPQAQSVVAQIHGDGKIDRLVGFRRREQLRQIHP